MATMTPGEAMKAVLAGQRKAAELTSELKELGDRVAVEGETAGLKQRMSNLERGAARAREDVEEAYKDFREHYANGEYDGQLEPGDGTVEHTPGDPIAKSGGHSASPLATAMSGAKFDLKSRPAVEVDGFKTLKSLSAPAPTDWSRRAPVNVPMGQDRRWLWPWMPMESAGQDTSIQDYRQTSRSLTGDVVRAVDATTTKAELDVGIELVTEELKQLAVIISDIPNQLLESINRMSSWLRTEGEFQVNKALDDHLYAQLTAAAPPFGTTGATLIEQVRNGVGAMRATGANPQILAVNPSDAATLDLATDAGGFVFPTSETGTSSPLWGLRVVERIGAGNEPPYLLDPAMLGVVYAGRIRFDADPYSGFKENLTNLRIEVNGLFHVRDANGARRIAAA